jgi:hypothetical protein
MLSTSVERQECWEYFSFLVRKSEVVFALYLQYIWRQLGIAAGFSLIGTQQRHTIRGIG